MHGVGSGCSLLANAEVDSMGGVIGGEDGNGTTTSPHQAEIEIAQAELRLEHDVREERRRELEFLEKGGNPLDFRFALAASLSVQSTSIADQIHDQLVTSEAKGSFAVINSPRGDSVESSGKLGTAIPCEPNSADNFDGGTGLIDNEGRAIFIGRCNISPSVHSTQLDGSQHVRESEGLPSFKPKKAYKRRNRSKSSRDAARFSTTHIASHGGLSSSLPSCPVVVPKAVKHEPLSDKVLDIANAVTINARNGCFSEGKLDLSTSRDLHDDLINQDRKDNGVLDAMISQKPDCFIRREETNLAVGECLPSGSEKPEDDAVGEHLSEPNQLQGDRKCLQGEDVINNAAFISKGLDSESSCTQTSLSIEGNGNADSDLCASLKNVDSNGDGNDQKILIGKKTNSKNEMMLDDLKTSTTESNSCLNDNHIPQSVQADSFPDNDEEETDKNQSFAQHEATSHRRSEEDVQQPSQLTNTVADKSQGLSNTLSHESQRCCQVKSQGPSDLSVHEVNKPIIVGADALKLPPSAENTAELVDKAQEDRILEEARIIEVKRKRIKELSIGPLPKEYHRKAHWDFVLEEMAWMANDFAQERLWKRTTASQLGQHAAFDSRIKLEKHRNQSKDKTVARTLARAVMEFWQSAGLCLRKTGIISGFEACRAGEMESENKYHLHNANCVTGGLDEDPCGENIKLALQRYMFRFMQYNSLVLGNVNTEASETPERESPNDMPKMTSLDHCTEKDLFYVVPHGAMEAYRKSIEIYTLQCEKLGENMLEDLDTSMNDFLAEFGSQENGYEEDEGESVYHLSGAFGGRKQPKFIQKGGRNSKSYITNSYEVDGDFLYDQCMENRISNPQSAVVGKRPRNGLNVGPIPTKRVRTASRQRVVGPTMALAGFIPVPRRTDASIRDANPFQDDQTALRGGSFIPRGLEVESRMDFNKQSTFDSAETTVKLKKKKKNKYQGEGYDSRWQVAPNMQGEQKDHFKRRMEYHQYESNGNNDGLLGPHAKKFKIMKQSVENSFENTPPVSGSVPSPVGSQMSNMSNQRKLIKMISGRDRGGKAKAHKVPSGQSGSGSPWSLFEDQALVVLVHDMGPNWELVSDAINSSLYFKCIFRKPKECKERHKVLIEKSCTDGADSAEDSGSSQPYPSTLPGIPKGGARQLFQQLRGPIEEDTIRCHFEKIILLEQQLHVRKKQEQKQLVPVHASHASALSQVIPNGGVLTPLDLCDMAASSPDVFSLNYQSPHSGGLPLANQGIAQPVLPSSGTNTLAQGPPGMGLNSNLSSPSAQLNTPVSGGRYAGPRASLQVNEQHRVQQYNHILSARNTHQTSTPVSGSGAFSGNERGLRMLPGGNGMVLPGMNRSMSIPRPSLQGNSSPSLSNSANAVASNMSAMPIHPGALHMGRNTEHPRQIMSPEMQLQASQANSQGVASFGRSSSALLNQPTSPSVPSYPVHHLQGASHIASAEQQAFAMRLARERQLQQRILQRQQQQFPTSTALTSHAPHNPLPNGMQNSTQSQSQHSPMTPVSSQQQQKHLNVGGAMNSVGKPRQRQAQQIQSQFQQSARHHLPQRQPSQPQQQSKLSKGIGKGNMSMHQNLPADSSHANGLPTNPESQREKGERTMHLLPNPASSILTSNLSKIPSGIVSRNHQQLKVHPSPPVKLVSHGQPTVQRAVSQNCVSEADQLTKPQYDQSRADLPLVNTPTNSSLE